MIQSPQIRTAVGKVALVSIKLAGLLTAVGAANGNQARLKRGNLGKIMGTPIGRLEWPRLYYDGIEHLLWNPDWIRAVQPDGSRRTIRAIMARLRRLEAPLHHTFHLFLALAPGEFVAKLLQIEIADPSVLQVTCWPESSLLEIGEQSKRNLNDLCQPDIIVDGAGVQVAVEVKSRSKSSLEQVLKYAALMLLRSPTLPFGARRQLVFLAPYDSFAEFWQRRAYADPDQLKEALQKFDDVSTDRKFQSFGTSLEAVKASLDDLEITWRSVRDVRRDVGKELERAMKEAPSPASEVYCKLLVGFERALREWQND